MNREQAIKELISIIPIGRTQKDRYIETLIEVINKPEPTEQEIFKKFEELGWKWIVIYTELYFTQGNKKICIDKVYKAITYSYKDLLGNYHSLSLTLQEHQLLTELFKCWGWI